MTYTPHTLVSEQQPVTRLIEPGDHLRAQVVPALDPSTPIYAGGFSMALIQRRMQEFNLWDESRFKTFQMRQRFQLGPFECAHRACSPTAAPLATRETVSLFCARAPDSMITSSARNKLALSNWYSNAFASQPLAVLLRNPLPT